jgi:hypothetical protein
VQAAPPPQERGASRGNEAREGKGGGKRDGKDDDKKP